MNMSMKCGQSMGRSQQVVVQMRTFATITLTDSIEAGLVDRISNDKASHATSIPKRSCGSLVPPKQAQYSCQSMIQSERNPICRGLGIVSFPIQAPINPSNQHHADPTD